MTSQGKSRILRTAVLTTFSIFCLWAVNQTNSTHIQAQKNSGNGVTDVPFSLSLYGSNAALSVANSNQLNSDGSLTVEAWIKISDINNSQVIVDRLTNDLSAGNGGYQLLVENGRATFRLCSSNFLSNCIAATGSTTVQIDRWTHIAAVYEPGQMRVYLNGRLDGRQDRGVRAPGLAAGNMTIGSSPRGVNRFLGLLDDIRISNAAVYTAQFSPSVNPAASESTKGLWRFDNGSMNDWSAYNHQTTIVGFAGFSPDIPTVPFSGFVLTQTPNVGPRNELNDVIAISPTDVWAVGSHGPPDQCCFPSMPVALRWNGTQWNDVPVPLPAGYSSGKILSIDAVPGSNNIWAVGTARMTFGSTGNRDDGWLLRWDGTEWTTAATFGDPEIPQYGVATVSSISVISDNDLWVVGGIYGNRSWTLHWDGKALTTIPSPNADEGGNILKDVSAISSNEVYAVGSFMAIRWNGTEWQIIPGSIPRSVHMNSVAAVSSNEIWVTGGTTNCPPIGGCSGSSGILRFDGANWSYIPSGARLNAVSANAPNDVWIVGSTGTSSYIAHFENGGFVQKPSQQTPTSDSNFDTLLGVSAFNPDTVFAVGFAIEITSSPRSEIRNTLALRYSP